MYKLREEDKEWALKAYDKQFTSLQMVKKLQDAGFDEEKIDAFIAYYAELQKEDRIDKKEPSLEEEMEFKADVMQYNKDPKKLSFFKRREIRKWFKNMEALKGVLKSLIEASKKEPIEIKKRFAGEKEKIDKELDYLKIDMMQRILDLRDAFELDHPHLKDTEIDEENIKTLTLDELNSILEESLDMLEEEVNGRKRKS